MTIACRSLLSGLVGLSYTWWLNALENSVQDFPEELPMPFPMGCFCAAQQKRGQAPLFETDTQTESHRQDTQTKTDTRTGIDSHDRLQAGTGVGLYKRQTGG